jgi:hypothetical protein
MAQQEMRRFQNYRAKFTVLDTGASPGRVEELKSGDPMRSAAPVAWR